MVVALMVVVFRWLGDLYPLISGDKCMLTDCMPKV